MHGKNPKAWITFLIKHSVFEWLYMCETKNGKENLTKWGKLHHWTENVLKLWQNYYMMQINASSFWCAVLFLYVLTKP